MHLTDTHPWLNAVAKADEGGHMKVGIMNTRTDAVKIAKGTLYGSFMAATDQPARYPWRVCLIDTPEVLSQAGKQENEPVIGNISTPPRGQIF